MPLLTFEIEGTVRHQITLEAKNETDAVAQFRAQVPGVSVESVNDRIFVGYCELSGDPIFDDDDYNVDFEEGIMCLRHHLNDNPAQEAR